MSEPRGTLILSGPPGVGKSTVARSLARRRSGVALDLDESVRVAVGRSPAAILRESGEPTLRAAEASTLESIRGKLGSRDVLALGGGTLTTPEARAGARALGPIAGLRAEADVLWARVGAEPADRPLLPASPAELQDLLDRRAESYASVDVSVDANGTPETVADRVLVELGSARVLQVAMGATRTRVLLGSGLAASATLGAVADCAPGRTIVLIEDARAPIRESVASALSARWPTVRIVLPGGEPSKTWERLGQSLDEALSAGAGRQSVVVGVGGGAVCDHAGMVAGLLGRGADLVLVPTTLLAQVDAAIGGKCAIDLGPRKNPVGLFHPARCVVVDPSARATESAHDRASGLAEVLKAGVIGDPDLFRRVARDGLHEADVAAAIAVKAKLVCDDPEDRGPRRALNLGHTLGHALEAATGYALSHGHAVAIGIAAIARMSAARGLCSETVAKEIEDALTGAGLPTRASARDLEAASGHLNSDKKGTHEAIELVLIREIGSVARHRLSWKDAATELLRAGG